MHSTFWKCFTSCKFSLHILFIRRTAWNFLMKFSDQVLIETFWHSLLCLKIETYLRMFKWQTCYYSLLTNVMKWYEVKTYIGTSSLRRCSVKKGFLRNFAKFTGKHLCQSLFFNKVAGLRRSWPPAPPSGPQNLMWVACIKILAWVGWVAWVKKKTWV